MKTLAGVDINLFPLEDTEFNQGKSEIKFSEAGLLGTVSLVSSVGDMAEIIRDGENGFLVGAKEEWKEKLQGLIDNSDLRDRVGQNANKYITDNYNLEKLGGKLDQFLNSLSSLKNT